MLFAFVFVFAIYDEFIDKYVFADDDYDDGYVDPGSFCSLLKKPSTRSFELLWLTKLHHGGTLGGSKH